MRVAIGAKLSPMWRLRMIRPGTYLSVSSTLTALTVVRMVAASTATAVFGALTMLCSCFAAVTTISERLAASAAASSAASAAVEGARSAAATAMMDVFTGFVPVCMFV